MMDMRLDILKNLESAEAEIERLLKIKKTLSLQVAGLLSENECMKAFIADKIHDATRERMLMEIKASDAITWCGLEEI